MRMKTGLKIFYAAVFNAVACLVLGEILVRVTGAAPPFAYMSKGMYRPSDNPLIGYEPIPNYDAEEDNRSWVHFTGKTNSLGFRDYEHAQDKPDDVYRIIVLGDSITQGIYVEKREHVFTSVLERELIKKKFKAEVFNFGVNGFCTQQEVEILKDRGLAFSPDLVVLAYCYNDRIGMDMNILEGVRRGDTYLETPTAEAAASFLMRSAAYRFLRYRAIPVIFKGREKPNSAAQPEESPEDILDRYFDSLSKMGAANDFIVLVAVFPMFDDIENYEHAGFHINLKVLSELTYDFHFIDLLPAYQQCAKTNPVNADLFHPNTYGHSCAGLAIAEYIQSNIL